VMAYHVEPATSGSLRTTTSDVVRWPEKGQFWFWKNPLTLLRFDWVAPEVEKTGECSLGGIMCTAWTPSYETTDFTICKLEPGNAEYLWFETVIPHLNSPGHWGRIPGDVLVDDGRLIFIGPHTDEKSVHVLANWQVSESKIIHSPFYQRGPKTKRFPGKTAYQHLLEDKLT
jgi:hypothetical protein